MRADHPVIYRISTTACQQISAVLHKDGNKHRKYKCHHCEYTARSSSTLRAHIRVHTGERPFRCPVCNQGFTQKGNMFRHVTKHFSERERRNRTCDWDLLAIYSGLKQELIGDKELNSTHHPYKCNLCPYTTFLPAVLRQHMLTHSIERPYKCPICDKGFTQKGSVQLHMLHHTGERPHKCPVCQRCYSQKGSMRRHILQHLIFQKGFRAPIKETSVNSENEYKCILCHLICQNIRCLGDHLMTHSVSGSNSCPLCQKTFYQKGGLRTHLKSHTGERPYACDQCGERFTHKHVLNNHKFLHTGEQPYKCPVCSKGFVQKTNMRLHVAKNHSTELARYLQSSRTKTDSKAVFSVCQFD
ncbi:zinc finger protein 239-like [Stegodyphus dumicola]|uniref:zinc finger protein 239-like n=1 Tax=Stegodyphus dumicola TaxID=202533 RepID=UPI0015B2C5A0|nr:zinc finger protein 239-like [Stegodyphus dumicola]